MKKCSVLIMGCFLFRAVLACADEPAAADPSRPERKGFTIQLSSGAALLTDGDRSEWHTGGLMAPNLSIGGFLSPSVALVFKSLMLGESDGVLQTAGPAVQIWLSDAFNVTLGGGASAVLSLFGGRLGAALMAEANLVPLVWKHHAVGLYANVAPIFIAGETLWATQFGLSWQYY